MWSWIRKYLKRRAYKKYIRSSAWRKLREAVKKRDGYECFVCGENRTQLDCHHLFYPRDIKKTVSYQCITLCVKCHKKIHKKIEIFNL
jgi:5-methylcytosine-specific restriction endonuclease McrA